MGKQTAVLVSDTAVSTNAESQVLRNGVAGHLTGEASGRPQGRQSLVTENNRQGPPATATRRRGLASRVQQYPSPSATHPLLQRGLLSAWEEITPSRLASSQLATWLTSGDPQGRGSPYRGQSQQSGAVLKYSPAALYVF